MRLWWLVWLALAACGDSWGSPDAAATADAPRGLVRVRVLADEPAVARGHRVLFQDADSQLVLATMTAGDGRANAFMAAGGSVTVAVVGDVGTTLYTLMEVTTEDEVVLDLRGTSSTVPHWIYVRTPEDPGALHYWLHSSCGSDGVTGADVEPVGAMLRACRDTSDLLVETTHADGEARFVFRDQVAIPANIRVTFDGEFQAGVRPTAALQHVPLDIRSVRVSQQLISEGVGVFPAGASGVHIALDEGAGSGELDRPLPLFPSATVATRIDPQHVTGVGALKILIWGPAAPELAFDYAGLDLRRYLTRPSYSERANLIGWIEGDRGHLPDALHAKLLWFDPRGRQVYWHIFAPRREDAWLPIPVLPDPDLRPVRPDVLDLVSYKLDGGFPRLRQLPMLVTLRPLLEQPAGLLVYQGIAGGGLFPD